MGEKAPIGLRLCTAAGCRNVGSEAFRITLNDALSLSGLNRTITVKGVGCLGPCGEAPVLAIDGATPRLYGALQPLSSGYLAEGLAAAAAANTLESWKPPGARPIDLNHPFFHLQRRWVLKNCGQIDPESIEEALHSGAYQQLVQVLQNGSPQAVVAAVSRSGLRGRGGAGYPTGLKWTAVASQPAGQKVVVCNADEGDPGAFMNRTVMEGDPHRLLEGMAIAAYAVGASRGFIYVRAEYPLAINRLRRAIGQAEQEGWLGAQVQGSDFSFQLELRIGAGAYVCGEETALIHSIEGKRGVPRPRPPYPAECGVFGFPTLINNVETFANVPVLLTMGADAYAGGTKVFSLTGQVRRCGVVEVPLGRSLRSIVETMGDGAPEGRSIKAVLTGGPSGGCVPDAKLDTPVDYDSLKTLGTIMGSGGMVVLDDSTNLVEIAAFFMDFSREESCGKCVPCRAGTVQLHGLLQKILDRRAGPGDLAQLETLCHMVRDTSLCGLGQSAPKPVLSTLRHFPGDYQALLTPEAYP